MLTPEQQKELLDSLHGACAQHRAAKDRETAEILKQVARLACILEAQDKRLGAFTGRIFAATGCAVFAGILFFVIWDLVFLPTLLK